MIILIDIVILSYAKDTALQKMTNDAIQSLIASEDPEKIAFRILVIESNKSLKPLVYPHTETIYPDADFNFNKYLNIGLRWGANPYVCFCNNDLLFEPGWASAILKAFEQDEQLMSASPICPDHHTRIGFKVNSGNYYGYNVAHEIAGWCIFAKRQLFSLIGPFDEHFKFWFADADYAKTLQANKQMHALVTTSAVKHLNGVSTKGLDNKMKQELTSGQFWYFQYKWEHRNPVLYLYRLIRSKIRTMNTQR